MITLSRMQNPGNAEFRRLMELYQSAFPLEERRDIDQLEMLVKSEPRMFFNKVEVDGELAGLFVYWNLGDFYYMEHLAVFEEMRNRKIGQGVLAWIAEHLDGLRILEAEPRGTEITDRRIAFYERNGYSVQDKDYYQLAYRLNGKGCRLWIMCNREDERLSEKIEVIRHSIYLELAK